MDITVFFCFFSALKRFSHCKDPTNILRPSNGATFSHPLLSICTRVTLTCNIEEIFENGLVQLFSMSQNTRLENSWKVGGKSFCRKLFIDLTRIKWPLKQYTLSKHSADCPVLHVHFKNMEIHTRHCWDERNEWITWHH